MNHPSPVVRLRGVTKEYQIEGKSLSVLRGVTLDIDPGQVVAIVGRSGAGKSTLLHIIGGLDKATSGEVEIVGRRLEGMNPKALADFRNRNVGFVFQFHHLLPEFTALENVAMPLLIRGLPMREAMAQGAEYLGLVGLQDRAGHKPSELSGGEQQRIAVARALIPQPQLVLADEPSGNLDSATGERLHALLWEISRRDQRTFIIVTHNDALAQRADRVLHMQDGVVVDAD
ncbi:MAG: ABC transporter ATP-binding protein [Chlorobi bacterium]|nr:ABC transporter ATP-binding protein [Chlorobiota bacterium]MBX7217689.1 ABC transporter ATP-binding protein [Candidatus Kapabacteria bacterium]